MMYLMLWEADMSAYPSNPDEASKLRQSSIETIRKNIESGKVKMWGISPEGLHGFVIRGEEDAKTLLTGSLERLPHVKRKIIPMLSFDEYLDVMKEMQQ